MRPSPRRLLLLGTLVALSTLACAARRATIPHPDRDRLQALYERAIVRSAVYRAEDRRSDLRAVTGPAVMASFLSCHRCDCDRQSSPDRCEGANCSSKCYSDPGLHELTADLWVSFAEELKTSCRRFPPGEATILGLQQRQGLPPNLEQPIESWKVLVVRVDGPAQLFRPCADPDPTTTGPCSEIFPCSWQSHETCSPERQEALEAHRAWIAGQAFDSWQLPSGYPWTRQGYTYDWNPRAASIVGSSEFVVREGNEIEVLALLPVMEFCHGGWSPPVAGNDG